LRATDHAVRARAHAPALARCRRQLCALVDAQLLTRTGLDWTHKYLPIASALSSLPVKEAYLDGELCGVRPDGKTSFSLIQAASDTGNADALVFFLFDLLYVDGELISPAPLLERKECLRGLLSNAGPPLQYSDHQIGRGPEFYARACELSLEGIISKRADAVLSSKRHKRNASADLTYLGDQVR